MTALETLKINLSEVTDLSELKEKIEEAGYTLSDLWDALETPVKRVLDAETGEQMEEAVIRKIDLSSSDLYLYADEVNGFRLLDANDWATLDASALITD